MKDATIIGWKDNFRMSSSPLVDNWTEKVPVRAAEANAVRIAGGFEFAVAAVAVRDGRIVDVRVADECTWWEDPNTCQYVVPEEGETIATIGWRTNDSDAEWIRGPKSHDLSSETLREIGAWRDAEEAERHEAAERREARRKAWERLVEKANTAYGRYASEVLDAHVRWAFEDQVVDLVKLLVEAPAVARALRDVPGGRLCIRVLGEFYPVEGPDYLRDALERISGPRTDSAVKVANMLLDGHGCVRLP